MDELALWLKEFTPSVCSSKQAGEKGFASLSEMEELVVELVAEKVKLQEKLFYLELDNNYQTNEITAMHEEIRRLRREKDLALETVLKLGADCRRKDALNTTLAGRNQEFFNTILGVDAQLGLLEHAYIDQWMAEKTFKALVGRKPKSVPLKDIKELLDSLRERIYKMSKELMVGIDLSK